MLNVTAGSKYCYHCVLNSYMYHFRFMKWSLCWSKLSQIRKPLTMKLGKDSMLVSCKSLWFFLTTLTPVGSVRNTAIETTKKGMRSPAFWNFLIDWCVVCERFHSRSINWRDVWQAMLSMSHRNGNLLCELFTKNVISQ